MKDRWFGNPHRGDAPPVGSPPSTDEILRFHRSLPGYLPTPLHALPALAASLGIASIHLKDESHRLGLGAFKVMGAAWAIQRARAAGLNATTLSTATAGNHGRAVAWTAKTLGLAAVIYIPAGADPVRVQAIRSEGARIVMVDGGYDEAVMRCAADSAESGWQVISDTGYPGYLQIPAWVSEGYSTIAVEADAELERRGEPPPDLVLVQGGVGSFAAAMAGHYARAHPRPRIVVVEPVEAACLMASARTGSGEPAESRGSGQTIMSGLNCARVSLAAWPVIRSVVEDFLVVTDSDAVAAIERLGSPAGADPEVLAGPSGAAGVAGLLALATLGEEAGPGLGPSTRVLVFNTEGPRGQAPPVA